MDYSEFSYQYTGKEGWCYLLVPGEEEKKIIGKFKKRGSIASGLMVFKDAVKDPDEVGKAAIGYFNSVGLYQGDSYRIVRSEKKKQKKKNFRLCGSGTRYMVYYDKEKLGEVVLERGDYGNVVKLFSDIIDEPLYQPMVSFLCQYFNVDQIYPHAIY